LNLELSEPPQRRQNRPFCGHLTPALTILDVFSRYVVGWMVADGESAELAKRLIADTCGKQAIEPGRLTIHADRVLR
jgi:transposase InsO family protein